MKVMIPKSKIEINQAPEFVESDIKLSISLLVSNRIGSIRKCMESLQPILKAIPSELIAVDTVGEENSDGSLAVVREYTDKIVHFDWTGDFAAARNTGLELAKGEWFLYVDDDEWFEDPSELIEFFQTGECMQYGFAKYAIRSYIDESMTKYSEGWVSRLFRLTPQTRFIHPVHEIFYPAHGPEKNFSHCYAYHVGYIFQGKEEKEKHFQRNIRPVLEELERKPDNLRIIMQAIQEYQFHEDYETALEFCRRGQQNQDPHYDIVWNWIVVACVRCLVMQKKYEQALEEGKQLLALPRVNELARINIDYLLVGAAEQIADSQRMLEYAEDYARLEQDFDNNPNRMAKQVMLTMGDVLQEDKREIIRNYLFKTYKSREMYQRLCNYAVCLPWGKAYMKQKLYFLLLIEACVHAAQYRTLTNVSQQLFQQEDGFPQDWLEEIQKVCNCEDKEKKYELRKAFAGVDCEEPYFLVLRAWCCEQDGGDVQAALQECLEYGLDCAVPREDLLGVCLRSNIDPSPFLEPLYLEDWVVSISQLVKNTRREDLQHLLDCTQKTLCAISESQCFVLSKMIRQRMLEDPDFPQEQLWSVSKAYAEDILGYNRSIYREELFADSQHNLPRETVFALHLQEALRAREEGNLDVTFEALKECVRAYPPRKGFVNQLVKSIEDNIAKTQAQQKEFDALGEQIKKQIYYLISLGEMAQAQQVLEQLRALTPNDLELDAIFQKIQV